MARSLGPRLLSNDGGVQGSLDSTPSCIVLAGIEFITLREKNSRGLLLSVNSRGSPWGATNIW
jgi:hypothetical protein